MTIGRNTHSPMMIVSSPTTISSKRTLPTLWFFIVYKLGLSSSGIVAWFDWFQLIFDPDRLSVNYVIWEDSCFYATVFMSGSHIIMFVFVRLQDVCYRDPGTSCRMGGYIDRGYKR